MIVYGHVCVPVRSDTQIGRNGVRHLSTIKGPGDFSFENERPLEISTLRAEIVKEGEWSVSWCWLLGWYRISTITIFVVVP